MKQLLINNVDDTAVMRSSKFPCKNCTDRYPGCHDKCEKYKERLVAFRDRKKALRDDWFEKIKPYATIRINKHLL